MLQRSSIVSPEEELQAYYGELQANELAPAWTSTNTSGNVEPASRMVPYVWRYRMLRPYAMRALALVGTKEAERRVIRCTNPGLQRGATYNLNANIQIVGPGEIARAHRHTPSALRMIIESTGGYTVINGEPVSMLPGDLVITPNWTWHDHANDSDTPMIWLDGLDTPLMYHLDGRFQEEYPADAQSPGEDMDVTLAKYGAGSFRPAWESPTTEYSPQMRYPWTQAKAMLETLAATQSGSPCDGIIMEYTNPLTGGSVMPTIACYVQMLRPGQRTQPHRHTPTTVYHVIEGQGHSIVGGVRLDWEAKDILTVPNWALHEHVNESTTEPAYLFSYTDEPVYRALRIFREES